MPATVEKRQTLSAHMFNLALVVTPDGKPTNTRPRKCPRCCQQTLEYASHVAVLSQSIGNRRKKVADESKDRLSYEPAWLCKNVACKYLRLIDV